jgi:AcrR family transcriptional regulator
MIQPYHRYPCQYRSTLFNAEGEVMARSTGPAGAVRPSTRPRVSGESKAAKAEVTRRRLVGAARKLFGRQGYADTSVDQVARAAGVTKGALYHHFRDKDDLFHAVVQQVKQDVTAAVGASFLDDNAGDDARERLHRMCLALIDAHLDPAVQRISIVDARAVFDAATRRDLDNRYEVSLLRGAFRSAMRVGAFERQPLGPLANIVAAALSEACALISEADDKMAARVEVSGVVSALLGGLEAKGQPANLAAAAEG